MRTKAILDTGPLVGLVNRREALHAWAREEVATVETPFFTCEAVLSDACFLLRNVTSGSATVVSLLPSGSIEVAFDLQNQAETESEGLAISHQRHPRNDPNDKNS